VPGQIVAMGGFDETLLRFAISLTGRERPRVAILPTAQAEGDWGIARIYETLSDDASLEPVRLFGIPDRPRERIAVADGVLVPGGNTANMLAVWRVHGVDQELAAAWQRGAVLFGWSAGMICWFEAGITDSFGPQLEGMRDGLGFLPGSACPHYDGEECRRPVYRGLVDDGFPPGYGADDGAALHFVGTELHEVVAVDDRARAYRIEPGSETPLEPRLL
jgi:peptidase E